MDPHSAGSGSAEHRSTDLRGHELTGREGNDAGRRGARAGESLRRGHSDGDVLSRRAETFNEQLLANGETWMDFLRNSGNGRNEHERAQIAIRRTAMMSADRRRRLTDQQVDNTGRRPSSNILLGQLANGRQRSGIPYPAINATPTPPPITVGTDSSGRQRLVDRPLPRRPSNEMQQSSRSKDMNPPAWQPDGEVAKCPICDTPFSFWYRKHHCRKCGRVVCANCSPHRITIPRQYIVHPPDQDLGPSSEINPGIEIVDLTGDTGEDSMTTMPPPRQTVRSQRHDHRIDPALGGGQEVRLCNPCVPDPNPLPHLYPPPARMSLDSFPRPDSLNPGLSRATAPLRRSSTQYRPPPEPVRASPGSQSRDRGTYTSSEASPIPSLLFFIKSLLLTFGSVVYLSLRQYLHRLLTI